MNSVAWSLVILGLSVVMDNLFFGMIAPIIPVYAAELGATGPQLGLLMASYSLAVLIFAVPAGMLSDKIGRKPMIMTGLFGGGVSAFLYALSTGLVSLVISRSLQGLFTAFIYSSCFAYLADTYPPNERGSKMGLLGGLMGVGLIIGPSVGGTLAEMGGISLPFFLCGGVFVLSFLIAVPLLRETRRRPVRRQPLDLRAIFTNANLMSVLAIITLITMLWGSLEVVYPIHVSTHFGSGPFYLGMVFGGGSAMFSGFRYAAGRVSDKIGRRPVFLTGILVLALAAAILTVGNSAVILTLAIAAAFLAYGIFFGVAVTFIVDIMTYARISGDPYGTASALYNFAWSLSLFMGATIGGSILNTIGFSLLHLSFAVIILTCFVWAYFCCEEPRIMEVRENREIF